MTLRVGALTAAIVLVATGCNWSQGFHWPRWYASGSTATETLVYFQDDLPAVLKPEIAWAAYVWGRSPALRILVVDTCPAGRNCVQWSARDWAYPRTGLTTIYWGSGRHLTKATVQLDPAAGLGRQRACHEAGHALGGGFENLALPGSEHYVCEGGWPTAHDYHEVAEVYDHHG